MPWKSDHVSRLKDEWNRLVRTQYKKVPRADFHPVPEDLLGQSDCLYTERSSLTSLVQCWKERVVPIRVLFHAGATITAYDTVRPANPSVALDDACKFRLAAMDAALRETPVDLLALLDRFQFPAPHVWSQNPSWAKDQFPEWSATGAHSLDRYARALFLKRIRTPAADFLAFQEAAAALDTIGVFQQDERGWCVDAFARDIFPSIEARAQALVQRRAELTWREEGGIAPPVVPEALIQAIPAA